MMEMVSRSAGYGGKAAADTVDVVGKHEEGARQHTLVNPVISTIATLDLVVTLLLSSNLP